MWFRSPNTPFPGHFVKSGSRARLADGRFALTCIARGPGKLKKPKLPTRVRNGTAVRPQARRRLPAARRRSRAARHGPGDQRGYGLVGENERAEFVGHVEVRRAGG